MFIKFAERGIVFAHMAEIPAFQFFHASGSGTHAITTTSWMFLISRSKLAPQ